MTYSYSIVGSLYSPLYKVVYKNGVDGKYSVDSDGRKVLNWNPYSAVYTSNYSSKMDNKSYIAGGTFDYASSGLVKSDATLQNRLLNKIKGHQFNLGVSLGESHQTFTMIQDNIRSIGLAARDVRHGQFGNAFRRFASQFEVNEIFVKARGIKLLVPRGVKRRADFSSHLQAAYNRNPELRNYKSALTDKDFANRWIEIQYGWLPLLSDVYEASKAISALDAPRHALLKVGSNDHGVYEASKSPSLYKVPGVWRVKQQLYYELREDLSVNRSLSLDDPYSVAWELLPYSFVIDWFLPIGTFLENLNQIPKLKGRSMKVVWYKSQFHEGAISSFWYLGSTTTGETVELTRTVSASGLPLAFPKFKPLSKALSPMHIYNACALARQHFPH